MQNVDVNSSTKVREIFCDHNLLCLQFSFTRCSLHRNQQKPTVTTNNEYVGSFIFSQVGNCVKSAVLEGMKQYFGHFMLYQLCENHVRIFVVPCINSTLTGLRFPITHETAQFRRQYTGVYHARTLPVSACHCSMYYFLEANKLAACKILLFNSLGTLEVKFEEFGPSLRFLVPRVIRSWGVPRVLALWLSYPVAKRVRASSFVTRLSRRMIRLLLDH